jgi:hypothetical protein
MNGKSVALLPKDLHLEFSVGNLCHFSCALQPDGERKETKPHSKAREPGWDGGIPSFGDQTWKIIDISMVGKNIGVICFNMFNTFNGNIIYKSLPSG